MKLGMLLVLVGGALLAQRVDVEFDKSVDFSKYRTFHVRDGELNSKIPVLNNDIARRNLELSIRTHLSARGWMEVSARPDLNVVYSFGSKELRDIDRLASRRRNRRVVREETPAKVQGKLDHMVEKIFAKYPPVKK